jgi:hypothetical protein
MPATFEACRYDLYVGESICTHVLAALKSLGVPAATVSASRGLWHGTDELTTVVTLVYDRPDDPAVEHLARELAVWFKQDCVLVTRSGIAFKALVGQSS